MIISAPLNRPAPNLVPRSAVNQELEALEMETMNFEPSGSRRSSSSSSISSIDNNSHGEENNKPPDYQHALKYRNEPSEKKDDTKHSSNDQPSPPSYDSVA